MSSILNSTALIRSIKRRGFIPSSQETFQNDDFLEIATEKINISLMSQLMKARGDYLIYFEDQPLVEDVYSYSIPNRAHGNKLREAAIVDENGKTVRELTQISIEDLNDYNTDGGAYSNCEPFYIQNNKVFLLNISNVSNKFIRMYFYMRPNKLVLETRAATASQVSASVEVDTITPKSGSISSIATTSIIISTAHGLSGGETIRISGSDSTPSIDGDKVITYIDANSFSISTVVTVAGTVGSWSLTAPVVIIPSLFFPKHFVPGMYFDIVSYLSPNNIKLYNIPANNVNSTLKTLSFKTSAVADNIAVGDFITLAEETIVPNVPTEYHPLLAQMVAVVCMEAMADEKQKQSANATLKEMEKDILNIVSNRVEGAPKKIRNRNGTLHAAARNRTYRRN